MAVMSPSQFPGLLLFSRVYASAHTLRVETHSGKSNVTKVRDNLTSIWSR